MIKLRDRDVHYGEMAATALPTMMDVQGEWNLNGHHNAVLFGPQPITEHKNPDGQIVRSPSLQSTIGLYVEISACLTEATTASADFIAQLRSLLTAAVAADAARSGLSGESDADGQRATISATTSQLILH
jgi:hypothetical protein